MEINNITNTNFTGTFILKPQTKQVKEAIPNIIKKGRQIFYNIKEEGDVVIVTKDKYDKRVRDFITSENLKFTYYPEISTQSGLDDQMPEVLKKLIKLKNNCTTTSLKILNKYLVDNKNHLSRQSEYLYETLNTLRLNVENPKITINDKGIFVIRDEAKQRTIESTGFQSGMAYAYILPDSINQEIKRFLIGGNGKQIIKEYNTPNDIKTFNKMFKKIADKPE